MTLFFAPFRAIFVPDNVCDQLEVLISSELRKRENMNSGINFTHNTYCNVHRLWLTLQLAYNWTSVNSLIWLMMFFAVAVFPIDRLCRRLERPALSSSVGSNGSIFIPRIAKSPRLNALAPDNCHFFLRHSRTLIALEIFQNSRDTT